MEFKDRLNMLRLQNKYTLEELGKKIGVGKSTISNYESGYRYPKMEQLEALADLFNVDLDYLTGRSDVSSVVSYDDDRILHYFHKLNSRGKAKAINEVKDISNIYEYVADPSDGLSHIMETIQYVGKIAAAGKGVYIDGIPGEIIQVKNKPENATFAIGVTGDSMETEYFDGDIVYVHQQTEIEFGEVGLWRIGAEFFIKEYGPDGLHSYNKKYPVIPASEEIMLVGKVIGKVKQ